jgi:T3SS negative regulator,GrlR
MLNALYTVKFVSGGNIGAGVAIFTSAGQVLGGDSQYCYTGTYSVDDGMLHSELNIKQFMNVPGNFSVFEGSEPEFDLKLSAKVENDALFVAKGFRLDDVNTHIEIELTKQTELAAT